MNKIVKYRGKNIEDMTREELIEALEFLCDDAQRERVEHSRQLDFITGQEKRYEISKEICPNCGGEVELSREATDTEYTPFDYSPYGVCQKCGYGVIKTPQGLIPLDLKRGISARRDNEKES